MLFASGSTLDAAIALMAIGALALFIVHRHFNREDLGIERMCAFRAGLSRGINLAPDFGEALEPLVEAGREYMDLPSINNSDCLVFHNLSRSKKVTVGDLQKIIQSYDAYKNEAEPCQKQ